MVIVAILITMTFPVISYVRNRVEKAGCISNLRNLHTAMAGHLQDHKRWPQIPVDENDLEQSAQAWIDTLEPYGLSHKNWICPTSQRKTGVNYDDLENFRVDYRASYYDPHPTSPYRWATQPWFMETGSNHGNGNLMIFQDGTIQELNDLRRESR